jgi:hypothetical protein
VTNEKSPREYWPIFVVWGIGSAIGFPTLLVGAGYLVDRGHVTLLGLPSFLLQSELTELGYLGYLWIAVTLQTDLQLGRAGDRYSLYRRVLWTRFGVGTVDEP